jgi:hypothetical protein
MRPFTSALTIALVSMLLAGCSAGNLSPAAAPDQPASVIPQWVHTFGMRGIPPHPISYDTTPRSGIYAAEFYGSAILGYRDPNSRDAGPVCKVTADYVNGLSIDTVGNLVVPNGYPAEVSVYHGSSLCGKVMGTFSDPFGQASDAASANAATGTIVVGNIEAGASNKVGNVAVCTLSKGCSRELKSAHITYYGGGVALAKNGDCWITSENDPSLSGATLTYFAGCKGSGQAARGWKNTYYGGLVIDKRGNLISIDFNSPALWVYKGCNPDCKIVGGPFALEGASFYGNLNRIGSELALGDAQYGQVDVYRYAPTKLTYEYSFNKGLTPSDNVEAAGFSRTF